MKWDRTRGAMLHVFDTWWPGRRLFPVCDGPIVGLVETCGVDTLHGEQYIALCLLPVTASGGGIRP